MRRTHALWVTSVVALLVGLYAAKFYHFGKKPLQEAMRGASVATMAQIEAESQEPEATDATPEDPGAVSGAAPLAVWMREDSTQPKATSGPLQPTDHAVAAEPYLRVEFPLRKSAQFAFVIPPHTVSPRLHGSFSSSITHSGADNSKHAADIDLVLMNAQQFDDFVHGRPSEATFELESSNRTVDFMLPAAYDQPQEYHLVFRDSAARTKLFVKADFSVNPE